jgi:hypothetical protein
MVRIGRWAPSRPTASPLPYRVGKSGRDGALAGAWIAWARAPERDGFWQTWPELSTVPDPNPASWSTSGCGEAERDGSRSGSATKSLAPWVP